MPVKGIGGKEIKQCFSLFVKSDGGISRGLTRIERGSKPEED